MAAATDKPLTYKEKAFAEFFMTNGFVGWRAAGSAGYQGSYETLCVRASENLAKPHVKSYIERRMNELVLDADQVISEISSIAQGEVMQFVNERGEFDIDELKKNGLIRNLESISTTNKTTMSLGGKVSTETKTNAKPASRSMALRDLLKVHDKIKPKTVIHVIGWQDALDEAYGEKEEE